MNRVYLDLVDVESVNAVLLYLPDNPGPINNLLDTKFPEGNCGELQVWGKDYINRNSKNIVIWFADNIYHHDDLIADLQMMDYTIIQLDATLNNFDKMVEYIEEKQL